MRRRVSRFIFCVTVSLLFCLPASAVGQHKKKNNRNYGVIEIKSTPGGFPILIDGVERGRTTGQPIENVTVGERVAQESAKRSSSAEIVPGSEGIVGAAALARPIQTAPGRHRIEVVFSPTKRYTQDLEVLPHRRYYICLNYSKRVVTVSVPCPYPVNVSAPVSVNDGDIITFASDVDYGGQGALNYAWTVRPAEARILSGVGTSAITVVSTGLGGKRITATLVVDDGSGNPDCQQRAQAATSVVALSPPVVKPTKFDEFSSIAFDDDKARFDNFAIQLHGEPDSRAYIFVYAGRTSRVGQADRLAARTRDYLERERGIDGSRLVIVNGGYRDRDYFELWIVPPGASPPSPNRK